MGDNSLVRFPWRYECVDCGSRSITFRTSAGGYSCQVCYRVMDEDEIIDKKEED